MNDKITIEIPIHYLLQIAVYGNMGTGDLSDMMKTWAVRELTQNGYNDQLKKEQESRLNELRNNIKNVIGKDGMKQIDDAIGNAVAGLKFATDLQNKKVN